MRKNEHNEFKSLHIVPLIKNSNLKDPCLYCNIVNVLRMFQGISILCFKLFFMPCFQFLKLYHKKKNHSIQFFIHNSSYDF